MASNLLFLVAMQELDPAVYQVLALLEEGGSSNPDRAAALELLSLELYARPKSQRAPLVHGALVLAHWLDQKKAARELAVEIMRVIVRELPEEFMTQEHTSGDGFERRWLEPSRPCTAPTSARAGDPRRIPIVQNKQIQHAILTERFRRM